MNRKRVREDILANLDKLPENFEDGHFYNPTTKCQCIYGWLGTVTGGPQPYITPHQWQSGIDLMEYSHRMRAHIWERYEVDDDEDTAILIHADRLIRAHARRPDKPWLTVKAPAMEVIQDFLAQEVPVEA